MFFEGLKEVFIFHFSLPCPFSVGSLPFLRPPLLQEVLIAEVLEITLENRNIPVPFKSFPQNSDLLGVLELFSFVLC